MKNKKQKTGKRINFIFKLITLTLLFGLIFTSCEKENINPNKKLLNIECDFQIWYHNTNIHNNINDSIHYYVSILNKWVKEGTVIDSNYIIKFKYDSKLNGDIIKNDTLILFMEKYINNTYNSYDDMMIYVKIKYYYENNIKEKYFFNKNINEVVRFKI